jgi:hypothetical protein
MEPASDLALLLHVVRCCENSSRNHDSWLETQTLLFSSISIVRQQIEKLLEEYYNSFEEEMCIAQLFV